MVLLILIGANLINGGGGKRVSGDQFCCPVLRRDGVRIYLLNADGLLDKYDSWQFQQSIYNACLGDP